MPVPIISSKTMLVAALLAAASMCSALVVEDFSQATVPPSELGTLSNLYSPSRNDHV